MRIASSIMMTNGVGRCGGVRLSDHTLVLDLWAVFLILCTVAFSVSSATNVSYDRRSLLIDGQRKFLISGSIHYTRSTPEMWPNLINLAKEGGLEVIETYVFWNKHEPVKNQYNFEGNLDIVAYVKEVQRAGLYAMLRIGPYVCAEWTFGGFPFWLREVPGIAFRTDNEPFKIEMQRFVTYLVGILKTNKLFASQGGPIILAQIENEYGSVQGNFGEAGDRYLNWTVEMAQNQSTGVPWTMCKQPDAPENIIDTCNGLYCDQYEPSSFKKPKIWSEMWTGWFHAWGASKQRRPVEDIAYAVAAFFAKGGSFVNYYMYHGGTNFGHTSATWLATSYDYDAPIDEYGTARQPKWGHLKELHAAIKSIEPALAVVNEDALNVSLSAKNDQMAYIYSNSNKQDSIEETIDHESATICAAFLVNSIPEDVCVQFHNRSYFLPGQSVSILPDCRTVSFNTAKVGAQAAVMEMVNVTELDSSNPLQWEAFWDTAGVWGESTSADYLLEQLGMTKDTTDYLWYTNSIQVSDTELPSGGTASLRISTQVDIARVFVNGKITEWPSSNGFSVNVQSGENKIDILSMTLGLPYGGPFFYQEHAGTQGSVVLQGLSSGDRNLTKTNWTYQIGLNGEALELYTLAGAGKVSWNFEIQHKQPLVWYKTIFDSPDGDNPVAVDLSSMGKGEAWINGKSIGRFWPELHNPPDGCSEQCSYKGTFFLGKCLYDCGEPTQRWYHVPRSWLQRQNNLLVVFTEIGGDPSGISFATQVQAKAFASISEYHPTPVNTGMLTNRDVKTNAPVMKLDCGSGYHISEIDFASFGNPYSVNRTFNQGDCHATHSRSVLEQSCTGKQLCEVTISTNIFGKPCSGHDKSLAAQVSCKADRRPCTSADP